MKKSSLAIPLSSLEQKGQRALLKFATRRSKNPALVQFLKSNIIPGVTLEKVRDNLSTIKGSLSEEVIKGRQQ